jgi:hypothetical protein
MQQLVLSLNASILHRVTVVQRLMLPMDVSFLQQFVLSREVPVLQQLMLSLGRVGFAANSAARTCLFYSCLVQPLDMWQAVLNRKVSVVRQPVSYLDVSVLQRLVLSQAPGLHQLVLHLDMSVSQCSLDVHVSVYKSFCSAPGSVCLHSLCSICTCAFVLHMSWNF